MPGKEKIIRKEINPHTKRASRYAQKNEVYARYGVGVKPILVTNAKFSSQAVKYSQGVGIDLLGWNYPRDRGLEKIIDNKKLYPITILPSLTGYLMEAFACQKMMLVQDILKLNVKKFCQKTKTKKDKILPLVKEAKTLMAN